jgi:hypothetical protein
MRLETRYGDIEPQIDWGDCPKDETSIEWYEEGPICPSCGHMWDNNGGDIGSWVENMGAPWLESKAHQQFSEKSRKQSEWLKELHQRLNPPKGK